MTKKSNDAENLKNKKNVKDEDNKQSIDTEEIKILSQEEIEQKAADETKQKADEYKDMLQRLQAEFDNYRKRTQENSRVSRQDGICDVITELLPAIDNIERGLSLIKDQSARSGMEMILKQLVEVLAKFDVCEINAIGQTFNPEFHHAIARGEDNEGGNEDKVTEVFMKGYQRKTKVLRPAMVKVSK